MTWEYVFDSDIDSIAEARGHVRDALVDRTDPDTLGHVELVVSELVTASSPMRRSAVEVSPATSPSCCRMPNSR